MKIFFKVIKRETAEETANGELEFPDDKSAVAINDEMMNANNRILNSLFGVQYQFESEEARKAFEERFKAELHKPKIVGADGEPIKQPGKIIQL